MQGKQMAGLVDRVAAAVSGLPRMQGADQGGAVGASMSGAERRARLALRIALLRAGDPVASLPAPVAEPPVQVADPAPTPVSEPPAETPAPPRFKPARVSMSTVRLEDAALLLAAASAPQEAPPQEAAQPIAPEPATFVPGLAPVVQLQPIEPVPAPVPAAKPKRRQGSVLPADGLANAAAALAALSADDEIRPNPVPEAATDATPAPVSAAKPKRRQGSVLPADGLANAAAALAALSADDEVAPTVAPSRAEAAMAAGLAALREAE